MKSLLLKLPAALLLFSLSSLQANPENSTQSTQKPNLAGYPSPNYVYRITEWIENGDTDTKIVDFSQTMQLKLSSSTQQHTQFTVIPKEQRLLLLLRNHRGIRRSSNLTINHYPELVIYHSNSPLVSGKFWSIGQYAMGKFTWRPYLNNTLKQSIGDNAKESYPLQYNFAQLFTGLESALAHALHFLQNPSAFSTDVASQTQLCHFDANSHYPEWNEQAVSNFNAFCMYDAEKPWQTYFARSHTALIEGNVHHVLEVLSPMSSSN